MTKLRRHWFSLTRRSAARTRRGLTLVEVVVALAILGGVLIGAGMFSVRLSQSTSSSRIRIQGAQLAADRLEAVKGAPRYSAIESLYVATESNVANSGYRRDVGHAGWRVARRLDRLQDRDGAGVA